MSESIKRKFKVGDRVRLTEDAVDELKRELGDDPYTVYHIGLITGIVTSLSPYGDVQVRFDSGTLRTYGESQLVSTEWQGDYGWSISPDQRPNVRHYSVGKVQPWDAIVAQGLGVDFALGNIAKYALRAKHKGQMREDVEKIRNYADMLLKVLDDGEA